MLGRVLSIALVTILAACSAAPNTQYLPIGQRCSHSSDCGTEPFTCDDTKPGGYCSEPCTLDGNCPTDSICVVDECRRKCGTTIDCRQTEGYICIPATTTEPGYCDTP